MSNGDFNGIGVGIGKNVVGEEIGGSVVVVESGTGIFQNVVGGEKIEKKNVKIIKK